MRAYFKFVSLVLVLVISFCCVSVFGVSAESGNVQPKSFIYGDVDFDGKVTIKDATLIQKGVAELEYLTGVQRYLVSPDGGAVTVKKATAIQKYLAGIDVKEECWDVQVEMTKTDEFSSKMRFVENNTELDRIMIYTNNPQWEYTLEDFPECDLAGIKVTHYDNSKYNYPDATECILYLANPGRESLEDAIRALDYRANLDLKNVYMITHSVPH